MAFSKQKTSTPKRVTTPPAPSQTLHVQSKIVLPPEAFIDTDTSGSYVMPEAYANGGIRSHDDFTQISGISSDIEAMMLAQGITRYAQLASESIESLRAHFELTEISDATIASWISQAQEFVTK